MDEGFQISCFGIVLTVCEIYATEQSLLNQRRLVLPRCKLDQELLEECMLMLWSHFARQDENAFSSSLSHCHDFFSVHSCVHLRVHHLKARHCVKEV